MSYDPHAVPTLENATARAENGPTAPAIFDVQDINPTEEAANYNGSLLDADKVEAPFEGPALSESEEKSGISGNLVDDSKVEAPFEGDAVNDSEVKAGLTDAPAAGEEAEDEEADEAPEPAADATIDEILAWVGDDAAKAKSALEAEYDGKKRATLITKLKAIS